MSIRAFFPSLTVPGLRFLALALLAWLNLNGRSLHGQNPPPTSTMPPLTVPRSILFFGDSLTAGYGLDNPSAEAFPALVGQKIKDAGLPFVCINAGLSGDTSSGGLRRIDWLLQRPVTILVLELGGNDGLRGLPTDETARNLQAIINKTRAKYPQARIVLAGMKIPPNLGADYVARFEAIYTALAAQNPGSTLLPFILEGVGGIARYNQRDQIHPTAEGHRIIAELVWKSLEPVCRAELAPSVPTGS